MRFEKCRLYRTHRTHTHYQRNECLVFILRVTRKKGEINVYIPALYLSLPLLFHVLFSYFPLDAVIIIIRLLERVPKPYNNIGPDESVVGVSRNASAAPPRARSTR